VERWPFELDEELEPRHTLHHWLTGRIQSRAEEARTCWRTFIATLSASWGWSRGPRRVWPRFVSGLSTKCVPILRALLNAPPGLQDSARIVELERLNPAPVLCDKRNAPPS